MSNQDALLCNIASPPKIDESRLCQDPLMRGATRDSGRERARCRSKCSDSDWPSDKGVAEDGGVYSLGCKPDIRILNVVAVPWAHKAWLRVLVVWWGCGVLGQLASAPATGASAVRLATLRLSGLGSCRQGDCINQHPVIHRVRSLKFSEMLLKPQYPTHWRTIKPSLVSISPSGRCGKIENESSCLV